MTETDVAVRDASTATCEVDDANGECLYRGTDLALACEIHDATPGAHLLLATAA